MTNSPTIPLIENFFTHVCAHIKLHKCDFWNIFYLLHFVFSPLIVTPATPTGCQQISNASQLHTVSFSHIHVNTLSVYTCVFIVSGIVYMFLHLLYSTTLLAEKCLWCGHAVSCSTTLLLLIHIFVYRKSGLIATPKRWHR